MHNCLIRAACDNIVSSAYLIQLQVSDSTRVLTGRANVLELGVEDMYHPVRRARGQVSLVNIDGSDVSVMGLDLKHYGLRQ
jgi:hypothetical protein